MTNTVVNPRSIPAFKTIFFDFDGTLSMIEGIDYLANINGVGAQVEAITAGCMGVDGITYDSYAKRLSIVKPSKKNIDDLAKVYRENLAPQVTEVLSILRQCQKEIFILSAGIREAILPVAEYLGIPNDHIHAVPIYFDQSNAYKGFDEQSSLIDPSGKKHLIEQLGPKRPCALVGDGMNDLQAKDSVENFIGYGGVFQHESIMRTAKTFVHARSFLCLLPLLLCDADLLQLSPSQRIQYDEGRALIESGHVTLKDPS